jgi:hypothetical protein
MIEGWLNFNNSFNIVLINSNYFKVIRNDCRISPQDQIKMPEIISKHIILIQHLNLQLTEVSLMKDDERAATVKNLFF